jgi:hypothetical protein
VVFYIAASIVSDAVTELKKFKMMWNRIIVYKNTSWSLFYFLSTIVMKVLISGTENPIFFIEVLDEFELFIDKKVILDEKKIPSVRQTVCRPTRRAVCQQIL